MITINITVPRLNDLSGLITDREMVQANYDAGLGMEAQVRQHLKNNGGKSFWGAASESTKLESHGPDGLEVGIYKRGVALQRYGSGGLPDGVVKPVRAKHLTIPAVDGLGPVGELHMELAYVPPAQRGGNGQYAGSLWPVEIRTITRGKRKGQSRKVATGRPLYWLYNWTSHDPHPDVLPSDDDLKQSAVKTMATTLQILLRRNARRATQ